MRYLGLSMLGKDKDIYVPVIRISSRELEIVKSLISNAIKYTPHTTENSVVHTTLRTMNNQLDVFFKNKDHFEKAKSSLGEGHWSKFVDEPIKVKGEVEVKK